MEPDRSTKIQGRSLVQRAPFSAAALGLAGVSMLVPWAGVVALIALAFAVVAKRRNEALAAVALVVTAIAVVINAVLPLVLA